jgi:hypothetical protein
MRTLQSIFVITLLSLIFMNSTFSQDTIHIAGGTRFGFENAGAISNIINGDTTAQGVRINPNRVYALNCGQIYLQNRIN